MFKIVDVASGAGVGRLRDEGAARGAGLRDRLDGRAGVPRRGIAVVATAQAIELAEPHFTTCNDWRLDLRLVEATVAAPPTPVAGVSGISRGEVG